MMKREEYIQKVTGLIKNKAARNDVKKELEAHIDDRTQYYLDAGYDEDVSVSRAVEMMGNPEEVAESLEKLHNNTLWIRLCVVSLCVFLCGLIYADFHLTDFAYINLVDFSETDPTTSIVSVITFCAATASFVFAVKSKSTAVLKWNGILTILSPLLSFFALQPAWYQFLSVFTDFPAALKNDEILFGNEVFRLFVDAFFLTDNNAVLSSLIFVTLMILAVAVAAVHIVTGILSLIYIEKLERAGNCGKYEKTLKKFTAVLVAVCTVMVVGTGAELIHTACKRIEIQQTYDAHKYEYYIEAKEKFDSIAVPICKEDALQFTNPDKIPTDPDKFWFIYNVGGQTITLKDLDEDGIYETKEFFNSDAFEAGIEKETLKSLKLGSSIEDLYRVADFSNFVTYNVCEADNETRIGIRICDKDGKEYRLEYTNGTLVSSAV